MYSKIIRLNYGLSGLNIELGRVQITIATPLSVLKN